MYLMIQNPGLVPIECFTILGLSMTREETRSGSGTIGQFGSGCKLSLNMLLRKQIKLVVYSGLTRCDFKTRSQNVSDGLATKELVSVVCELSGKIDGKPTRKTLPLNWDVSYGAFDWNDVWMALREFVVNALDRTYREFSTYRHDDFRIEIVEDNQVRAKDGLTRVFIEMTDEVEDAYKLLNTRILHLTKASSVTTLKVLRNTEEGGPTVYKNGIYVRKLDSEFTALRNYNCDNELKIDESRNVNDGDAVDAISQVWANSSEDVLVGLMKDLAANPNCWEAKNLSRYYTTGTGDNWKKAFIRAYGENACISTSSSLSDELLSKKGYRVIKLNEGMVHVFKRNGCMTTFDALNADEREGREIVPATVYAETAIHNAWNWMKAANVVPGELSPPTLKCFREVIQRETKLHGFLGPDKVIYLNRDYADGMTTDLMRTAVEEVAHYVSKAPDCTRNFQDFLIDTIVGICK